MTKIIIHIFLICFLTSICFAQEVEVKHDNYIVEYIYNPDIHYPPSPLGNIHYSAIVKVFEVRKKKLIWQGEGTYTKEQAGTKFESDPENYIRKAISKH